MTIPPPVASDRPHAVANGMPPQMTVVGRRVRLLIVEDRDELRAFIRRLFEDECEVFEATDGDEGYEAARQHRPDVIVSDVMMPGRSGVEMCAQIKEDPELCATPVILLTARVGSDATLEAYAHGADDFVAKPFHPRVLVARVRAQVRLRDLVLQLTEQEKLATIGTLAAGVAHEVRNPVNAIIAAVTALTERNPRASESERRLLDVAADGGHRIQEIVSALETHARPAEHGRTEHASLRDGLEATLRLLEYRMDGVAVHRDYASERLARVSAGSINQVFLNLLDNALRSGAETLWIEVADAGEFLAVRIADDGPGVPVEVRKRVFDAFFTTREPGAGTGLGLFLSRKIVDEAGGSIRVRDREGGGALFELELPATAAL